MKKNISGLVLSLFLSNTLFAAWSMISLQELTTDSDLIVTGTLHSVVENSEGLGKGYIIVDKVITKSVTTFAGVSLNSGNNLKITWADNWACASGMHRGRENEEGIWLLQIQKDGTVTAAYPGRFRPLEDLSEIEKLLNKKKTKRSGRVDVLPEINAEIPVRLPAAENRAISDDTAPFSAYSPFNALLTAIFSLGLYRILYRNRFRIR